MTRKILIGLFLVYVLIVTGCNQQIVDTVWKFNKAMIRFPDGSIHTVDVRKWSDYTDSDMIQIITKDGTVYCGHSNNILLIKEP